MTKSCVICGAEFEPYKPVAKSQKCCSKKCSRINDRITRRKHESTEESKMRRLKRKREKAVSYCHLCGKQIERNYYTGCKDNKRMHDECVYSEIISILNDGKTIPKKQRQRLYHRGWTIAEFKDEMWKGVQKDGKD